MISWWARTRKQHHGRLRQPERSVLGFAGSNDINAFGTSGNDTLVGGTGFNSLFGGDGTDWIYDYPNQASWNQAIQQAAALHVQLASPIGWNPGGSSSSLWNLLDSLETEPQQFTSAKRTSLASLLSQDYKALGITNPTGAEVETQLYDEATQSTPNNGAATRRLAGGGPHLPQRSGADPAKHPRDSRAGALP